MSESLSPAAVRDYAETGYVAPKPVMTAAEIAVDVDEADAADIELAPLCSILFDGATDSTRAG